MEKKLSDSSMKGITSGIRILFYRGISLLLLLTGLFACNKYGSDCLESTGRIKREVRHVAEFDSIEMQDNVSLILRDDSVTRVEVEAGENILDGIETSVIDRRLVIRNNTTCNWLRSYAKPLNVYVSIRNLRKIYYNSAGNVTTLTPMKSDNLTVDVWGGSGTIDMDLDIHGFGYFIIHMGSADIKLRGLCSICAIFAGDFGPIQAKDLETGYCYAVNNGSNDIYVRAQQYLSAKIESIGNIYYTGDPDTLEVEIHGPGQVIPF
jgi:hypothetical protein